MSDRTDKQVQDVIDASRRARYTVAVHVALALIEAKGDATTAIACMERMGDHSVDDLALRAINDADRLLTGELAWDEFVWAAEGGSR